MASSLNADNGVVSGSSGLKSTADTSGVLALQSNGSTGLTLDTALNVGIGTTSPSYKLDVTNASDASLLQVKSTANANNTSMRLGIDGNNSFINATGGSTGILQLRTYGTTQATLDASGNLGLGVTPSAWRSTIKATQIGQSGSFYSNTNANAVVVASNDYVDSAGADRYIATGYATLYQQVNGQHQFYNAASGTAGNTITFTQAMTLDANGNLCIGSTSVTNVSGYKTISLQGSTQGGIFESTTGSYTTKTRMYSTDSGGFVGTASNHSLGFLTNDTQRFVIGASGQLGIGASPSYGTSGQVLTSGGASAAPTWATASSGAIVYLSTTTASNSATVSVEDAFNVYDTYMLVITDLLPSNDNYGLNLTFKLGGTYQTSAFYNTTMTLATSATTSVFRYGGINTTSVYLANAITNNATSGFRTVMYIPKPSSTASYKSVYGSCQYNNLTASNDSRAGNYGSIFTNSTAALTGLRFAMDAGNIASGTFRLYGISNS